MRIPMPAAVLAGGASRRMGRPKAALPYGAGTLLEFQTSRLAGIFEDVFIVAKEPPAFPSGPGNVLLDRARDRAAIHGLVRALEEARDRIFVLGVDLPVGRDDADPGRPAQRNRFEHPLAVPLVHLDPVAHDGKPRGLQLPDDLARIVEGSVVAHDELEHVPGALEGAQDLGNRVGDHLLLVEAGCHHG